MISLLDFRVRPSQISGLNIIKASCKFALDMVWNTGLLVSGTSMYSILGMSMYLGMTMDMVSGIGKGMGIGLGNTRNHPVGSWLDYGHGHAAGGHGFLEKTIPEVSSCMNSWFITSLNQRLCPLLENVSVSVKRLNMPDFNYLFII